MAQDASALQPQQQAKLLDAARQLQHMQAAAHMLGELLGGSSELCGGKDTSLAVDQGLGRGPAASSEPKAALGQWGAGARSGAAVTSGAMTPDKAHAGLGDQVGRRRGAGQDPGAQAGHSTCC